MEIDARRFFMQRLIQPVNQIRTTVSFKDPWYEKNMGNVHYGTDVNQRFDKADQWGNDKVWASGEGKVLAVGSNDKWYGNYVVVRYDNCVVPRNRNEANGYDILDLVVSHFHLASTCVKAGDTVTPSTGLLGYIGSTGNSTAKHLHIEVRKHNGDNRLLSAYASTYFIKGGDWIDPYDVMYCKTSKPDCQTRIAADYVSVSDKDKTKVMLL